MSERWTPKVGGLYYFISTAGEIISETFYNYEAGSRSRFLYGNVFETQAAAEAAAEKVKELLLSLHEPATDCNQLPKLTAEVFDRPDCPEWAQYAVVNMHGTGYFYEDEPSYGTENYKGMWYVDTGKVCMMKDAIFNAVDWQNSLIERPTKDAFNKLLKNYAEQQADKILQKARERRLSEQYHNGPEKEKPLPDWCKVGEWVWSPCDGGCYCRVSEIDGNRIFTKHRNESICFHIDKGDDFSSLRLCEARLRPWNFEEAPFAVKCRHSITAIEYQVAKLNSAGDGYTVADCCCEITLQGMANYYEQMDGSPCGVLEHLNENGEWMK